ncbi:MAG: L,D-transpeptidase family protein [Legionellales bacterium]|nr:L,D-transpeptidase family protein [Legionellales bacterium]
MATLRSGVSLSTVAENYDIGYYELLEANPQMNPMRPYVGERVLIPTQYVLPQASRQGIIINLAELRLYYFPPGQNVVVTEPIGIGRQGWDTPLGTFKVIEKIKDPTWHVPASIAADSASKGVILPKTIPPGPDNPLGQFAMRLSLPNYLIHGTNRPAGVGRRVSSGCIRMYPEDIESLFQMVAMGTPVTIVNQSAKAGWLNGHLYLESTRPLSEQRAQGGDEIANAWVRAIDNEIAGTNATINWNKAKLVAGQQSGVPQIVSAKSMGG